MSEKTKTTTWCADAESISMDNIDAQLFKSKMVLDFLDGKFFVVADKGLGKTLLLKKRKYDLLEKKRHECVFIPTDSGCELDMFDEKVIFSKEQWSFLENKAHAELFWSLAIQLSAIKNYQAECGGILRDGEEGALSAEFKEILKTAFLNKPCEIFGALVRHNRKMLNDIYEYVPVLNTLFDRIEKKTVCVFIDSLDQALKNEYGYSKKMWINIQLGLLEAARDLRRKNLNVKIFCSIRKEAYDDIEKQHRANLVGSVCVLNYTKAELHELINKLVKCFEPVDSIEKLVGFGGDGSFVHSKTGRRENVFDYILRHTVERPRDLIRIGSSLRDNITPEENEVERADSLIDATLAVSRDIVEEIFREKANFLECIKEEDDRKRFFSLIPKNTLTWGDVVNVCKRFNGRENEICSQDGCAKVGEEKNCKHPFCDLYNVGLFGYVDPAEDEQVFNTGGEKTMHVMNGFAYFVVHPSLKKILSNARKNAGGKQYVVTPGIIVGNGYTWTERDSKLSDLIDRVVGKSDEIGGNGGEELLRKSVDRIRNGVIEELNTRAGDTTYIDRLCGEVDGMVASIENDIRGMRMKNSLEKIRVFLSYRSKDSVYADAVESSLKRKSLNVTRDEGDMKFMKSVEKFMETLKDHNFVITLISAEYLKSENCMKEVGKLLEIDGYEDKTILIILPSAEKIHEANNGDKYVAHWKRRIRAEKARLVKAGVGEVSRTHTKNIGKRLKNFEKIVNVLPKFLDFVGGVRYTTYEKLQRTDYVELVDYVLEKEKEKKAVKKKNS